MPRLAFNGGRVLLPDGLAAAQVLVDDERIIAVSPLGSTPPGFTTVDVIDAVLIPGLVDTHVHVNEPGRTEWEGFATATRAAAAGGVTTLLDMPLNSIPATTTAAALAAKRAAAEGCCHVDVGFIGGIVPDNADSLRDLHTAGVFAWKCFLTDSGVAEFANVDEAHLRRVLPLVAELGIPLMVHAELPEHLIPARAGTVRRYVEYAATRPERAEVAAVQLMVDLSQSFGAPVHIVHVSSAAGAELIAQARSRGVRISGETCPHYLSFAAEEIRDGATEFKCAPPIRSGQHRDALWRALANGALEMIVSDHSPSPPALKCLDTGDLMTAWGGIASLELGLSAAWTNARQRNISLEQVIRWMSVGPADLVRLSRKGRIGVGCDADLVIWDPDARWAVDQTNLQQRHPLTPYHGLTLAGVVRATYLRGQLIYEQGEFPPPSGRGRLLERSHG